MLDGHGKEVARFVKDKPERHARETIHVMQDGCLLVDIQHVIKPDKTGHSIDRFLKVADNLDASRQAFEESGYTEEPDFLW